MNLNFIGKRALVCGSSQGIGRACAEQLAELGCHVTLFARNEASLQQVKSALSQTQGQQHQLLVADFSQPNSVKAAITEHIAAGNRYDILINNTGGPAPGPASQAAVNEYLAAFQQHLVNNQILLQALLPGMRDNQWGRIINVISTSVKQPIPGLGVSNTIRGAVANWAKSLAYELGPDNITVNNVLPGATETGRLDAIFSNKAAKLGKDKQLIIEEEKQLIPLRRFAKPSEFAAAVAFLASESASYITGINLPVDGGRTLSL